MSTFEDQGYQWRETYFVLFDQSKRPSLTKISAMLKKINPRFQIMNTTADENDHFESVSLQSPDDYAALDISYIEGEEVTEQAVTLAEEMRYGALDKEERARLGFLKKCNARFDVMHFEERVVESPVGDDDDEVLDPGALLIVLDSLIDLTKGVGIDPQSGGFL